MAGDRSQGLSNIPIDSPKLLLRNRLGPLRNERFQGTSLELLVVHRGLHLLTSAVSDPHHPSVQRLKTSEATPTLKLGPPMLIKDLGIAGCGDNADRITPASGCHGPHPGNLGQERDSRGHLRRDTDDLPLIAAQAKMAHKSDPESKLH